MTNGEHIFSRWDHQFSNVSDLNISLRSSDDLLASPVPGHTTLELRLAWTAVERLESLVVGENLFQGAHPNSGLTIQKGK